MPCVKNLSRANLVDGQFDGTWHPVNLKPGQAKAIMMWKRRRGPRRPGHWTQLGSVAFRDPLPPIPSTLAPGNQEESIDISGRDPIVNKEVNYDHR
jgi:hypothetical protein